MPLKITFDLLALQRGADQALETAVKEAGSAIRQSFEDPVYSWPGVTKRRNGSTVGTRRNVVDLGELQRSQTPPIRVGVGHYQIQWLSDHAAAVFLGAVYKRRAYVLPARNVPLNALRDFDFEHAFAQAWKSQ